VDLNRYGAERSFMMLGNGLAAIAMPGQVNALLAALSRRGSPLVSHDGSNPTVLIEADGIRDAISFGTMRGPFPMPSRAALGLYQVQEAEMPTGAVTLRSEWQYDTHEQADHARDMLEYSRTRWHAMINERLGQRGGLGRLLSGVAASMVGVDLGAVESALDALNFTADGNRVVVRAALDARQVRALLNLSSLGRM
jgi:hypothetical protein